MSSGIYQDSLNDISSENLVLIQTKKFLDNLFWTIGNKPLMTYAKKKIPRFHIPKDDGTFISILNEEEISPLPRIYSTASENTHVSNPNFNPNPNCIFRKGKVLSNPHQSLLFQPYQSPRKRASSYESSKQRQYHWKNHLLRDTIDVSPAKSTKNILKERCIVTRNESNKIYWCNFEGCKKSFTTS
ncbi:hypothetical protein BB560_000746 [Smittium megazygosporum]|uniref:Uncharacterized protein n=1 Tax=Smittium megazygosporum TaxID=133381 RepID=A0A2T9ZJL4_9FUNG|nr:hypothetical protein BB560_000746 [Smittium megazygosporum]